jgi:hypothetical protein
MDTKTMAALAGLMIAAAAFCGWRGARPWNPHRGPRLVPWRPLMALLAATGLLLLVQVGIHAGLGPNTGN